MTGTSGLNPETELKADQIPLEIERKFLIRYPDIDWLTAFPGAYSAEIIQTYLIAPAGASHRVRRWEQDGAVRYYETLKRPLTDRTREEYESEIDQFRYEQLLHEADLQRNPVRKTRWCIPYEGHLLEIDLYPFWKDLAILECELQEETESFLIPDGLTIVQEVTGDPRYLNSSLALRTEEH